MRRHLIGIIGLLLLCGAVAFEVWPPDGPWAEQSRAACWRVGPVLILLWMAYNELTRLPAWLLATFPPMVIVLAVRPRIFLLLVPVLIALAILQPRFGRRRRR